MEEQKNNLEVTNNNQALVHRLNVLFEQINMRTQELVRLKMENANVIKEMEEQDEIEKLNNQSQIQIA